MATDDKSLTPHTLVNHVETSTASTGDSEKSKSESNLAQVTDADDATVDATQEETKHRTVDMTTTDAVLALPPTTAQLAESEAPASPDDSSSGIEEDSAADGVPAPHEEKKDLSETTPNHQMGENDEVVPAGKSTVSMPTPTEQAIVIGVEIKRSKSEGEVEGAVLVAPAIPGGVASEDNRRRIGSVDDDSHLQELLTSHNVNNQIVERSPGERYVRFSEKLGSGASKDVYRAYDTEEGIEVAWNVVHLAGVPKNERNRIVNEVRLLERLHHQNIISFHGSWINREQQQVNFVTEILSSGTLKSFINKVQVIRWKIAKRWAVQILKGLEYLHSQEPPVIHRDLKCENIFINGTSGDLRIGDLGLSTVHRNNGKALSVLGTPEFMAPDMYEEGSYDEKVDIYAFGMCLLEIFTKEIPYKECNNPAQIYKKVTRGAPPDSLCRLKSTHARKFIELCLGYRNEDGKYVRPSATELLDHPFLVKRAVDDEEVEVDPPLQEQAIIETVTRSGERSTSEFKGVNASTTTSAGTTSQSQNNTTPTKETPQTMRRPVRQNSLEEEESDRFAEMPESEVNNMKKVKVMMGRGEELKEDDVVESDNENSKRNTTEVNASVEVGSLSSLQNVQQNNDGNGKKLHYLVAAAVIEGNEQNSSFQQQQQPYHDDILKLMITLPVEGETQNVQFDFHLVEDDPIQVAKEMVAELGIPEEAVLEISETISGLARVARTKKHKFNPAKPQQNTGHIRTNSIISTRSNPPSQAPPVGQTAVAQQQQHMGQTLMQPANQQQQQPMQDYVPSQQQQIQQPPGPTIQQQPIQQQTLPLQDQPVNIHGQQIVDSSTIPSQIQHIQQQQQHASTQNVDAESHHQAQMPYFQAGMDISPQLEATSHSHQSQMNGEYHQGHVSSETKHTGAPYGQSSIPAPIPSIPAPANSSQSTHSQIAQQVGSQQSHTPHDSGTPYSQPAPNQIQSQTVQYPSTIVPQPSGHVTQPGGSGQHAITPALQQTQHMQNQQIHSGSQGRAQGYGQHQQLQHSLQHGQSLPQQQQQQHVQQQQPVQQPVQQMQNIPQQHMQNDVQQPPPMQIQMNHQATLPQQQLKQPVANQHQLQPGISQQLDHRQQQPPPIPQQHSTHTQNQQQQPNSQMPNYQVSAQGPTQGQRVTTAVNSVGLPIQQGNPASLDFVPIAPQNESSRLMSQEGSLSSATDHSTVVNNQVGTISSEHQQEDYSQGESIGVLEGLSIDTSGEDEPSDEVCLAELRKLDQDFENNLKRAKKVFVDRMDTLQRTQVQREAQHQKTLEQHQKDRTAFEKRLQQEEIEQNRRIEQMQKEWDRKREEVRSKDKV